ncbi:hypothetical protein C8034_v010277 [Colletotrichum sidae]|uniref:DNA2/NAM7 helicase-like C-terminal domain-containing protein n=1 Tax=Colletotrichum sidae TaxID=1347389 RepID=A0A4V3I3J7_9PEZI|nr:hypothetical protein C8034_v010277 [Colletotrichum sidae]
MNSHRRVAPQPEEMCLLTFGDTVKTYLRSGDDNDQLTACKFLERRYMEIRDDILRSNKQFTRGEILQSPSFKAAVSSVLPDDVSEQIATEVKECIFKLLRSDASKGFSKKLVTRLAFTSLCVPKEERQYKEATCEVPMSWTAMRTLPPVGADIRYDYFVACVPDQPNSLRKANVPVDTNLPKMGSTADVQSLCDSLTLEHNVTISAVPSEATTSMEMRAISDMALADADSNRGIRWAYSQKFDTSFIPAEHGLRSVNFHTRFPEVGRLSFQNTEGPQRELLDALKNVPCGIAFYTGGPGSGKSTFAGRVAVAAVSGTSAKRERVIWTLHTNALCDDAALSLLEKMPEDDSKRVGRLHLWRIIRDALVFCRLGNHAESLLSGPKQDVVSQHIHGAETVAQRGRTKNISEHSVAHVVVELAMLKGTFPDFWKHKPGNRKWEAACRLIFSEAVNCFDILVGTPYVVGELGEKLSSVSKTASGIAREVWDATLLVIDEAGCIPEAQWWIPLSAFPNAMVLSMGDIKQFRPGSESVTLMQDNYHADHPVQWTAVFGEQRTVSILERAQACGQVPVHLSSNRRNRGHIALWASTQMYHGKMDIVYPLESDAGAKMYQKFIDTILVGKRHGQSTNSAIFDVPQNEAVRQGKDVLNPGNRKCALWIAEQAFQYSLPNLGSPGKLPEIMIVTPYSAQMLAYRDEISRMTASGVLECNVTARTIDNSMSSEADLVIFDVVRSGNVSAFINNRERMAVATTRARGGAITLTNYSALPKRRGNSSGNRPFNDYVRFQKLRVKSHLDWNNIH